MRQQPQNRYPKGQDTVFNNRQEISNCQITNLPDLRCV